MYRYKWIICVDLVIWFGFGNMWKKFWRSQIIWIPKFMPTYSKNWKQGGGLDIINHNIPYMLLHLNFNFTSFLSLYLILIYFIFSRMIESKMISLWHEASNFWIRSCIILGLEYIRTRNHLSSYIRFKTHWMFYKRVQDS